MADPITGPQQGQIAADHDGGVGVSGHGDIGAHGGGGGLAVGAGDADGVAVVHHDGAPRLCPLKDRNTGSTGGLDLRIVVMDGSSADDQICPLDILGKVADGHMEPLFQQVFYVGAFVGVRAGDDQATHL